MGTGRPPDRKLAVLNARLTDVRDVLNAHADRLHRGSGQASFTPYEVIGHLVRLRQQGVKPAYLKLDGVAAWSREEFEERSRLITELAERVVDLGAPGEHLWRGIDRDRALPPEIARIEARLEESIQHLADLRGGQDSVLGLLEMSAASALGDLEDVLELAVRVASAPDIEPAALAADIWKEPENVRSLISLGSEFEALRSSIDLNFAAQAWDADVAGLIAALDPLDSEVPVAAFLRSAIFAKRVPEIQEVATRLAKAIGREVTPATLADMEIMAQVGERVSHAPDADPAAFAQDLWDSGVERAADLANAVKAVENARSEIGTALSDSAWNADLSDVRRSLAAHGTSFFRFFNSEWRAADRLVRSYLANPKAPLERRLGWLDALSRGQTAQKAIWEEDGFGRSAFGTDWRGERSSARASGA